MHVLTVVHALKGSSHGSVVIWQRTEQYGRRRSVAAGRGAVLLWSVLTCSSKQLINSLCLALNTTQMRACVVVCRLWRVPAERPGAFEQHHRVHQARPTYNLGLESRNGLRSFDYRNSYIVAEIDEFRAAPGHAHEAEQHKPFGIATVSAVHLERGYGNQYTFYPRSLCSLVEEDIRCSLLASSLGLAKSRQTLLSIVY